MSYETDAKERTKRYKVDSDRELKEKELELNHNIAKDNLVYKDRASQNQNKHRTERLWQITLCVCAFLIGTAAIIGWVTTTKITADKEVKIEGIRSRK